MGARGKAKFLVAAVPTEKGMKSAWQITSGFYAKEVVYPTREYEKLFEKIKSVAMDRLRHGEHDQPFRPSTEANVSHSVPLFRSGGFINAMRVTKDPRQKDRWSFSLDWPEGHTNERGWQYHHLMVLFGEGRKEPFKNWTRTKFKFWGVDGDKIESHIRHYPTEYEAAKPTGKLSSWGFPRRSLFPTVPRVEKGLEAMVTAMLQKNAKKRPPVAKIKRIQKKDMTVEQMAKRIIAQAEDAHAIKVTVNAAAEHMEKQQWEKLVKRLGVKGL